MHPANAERLAAEGLTTSSAVLEAYLLPGTPGYRARLGPTVEETVAMIHGAGGLAVWAHPFWDVKDPDDVIDTIARFAALGLRRRRGLLRRAHARADPHRLRRRARHTGC